MSNRRLSILKHHGMMGAPQRTASLFWQRYNQAWKRREENLGELASVLVESSALVGDTAVSSAWDAALPAAYQGRARAENLLRGKLNVLVDCKATAYVLTRRHGVELVTAMNVKLGTGAVRRIEYRVRPAAISRPTGQMLS